MVARKVLVITFPGFNTLDLNGPFETLHSPGRGEHFVMTLAAENEITTAAEGVHVKRDVTLDQDLIDSLDQYDVLVVPGAPIPYIDKQVEDINGPFMQLIAKFANTSGSGNKTLLSICTGAIFLGTMGVFNNRHCTTHWASYDRLKQANIAGLCDGKEPGKVLAARFVDSGLNESGVRIVSAGGVSSGIDGALHVVKLYAGEEAAKTAAANMDYAWRKTEGVVFL